MALEQIFASLAAGFSTQFGAPYHDAVAVWSGTPAIDDGGSIVTPGAVALIGCKVQGDAATEAMRSSADFLSTDIRLLVIGLTNLDSSANIDIADGPHAGLWSLLDVSRDPAGIGFECRARRI